MVNISGFQRPSRYINSEINSIRKDAPLKVALAFPDVYEVGMSHLGLKILYHIINSLPYASAERVFHPWSDLEKEMRARGLRLASLESGRALSEFDAVGFSLQYELSYTSVLNMLSLGGIPMLSAERDARHPVVLAGGPCTVNPMPVLPFIDAFVVGDAEEAVVEIMEAISGWKAGGDGRRESLLSALSKIEGVLVPSMGGGVRRRVLASLEDAPFPTAPVLPFAEIVHDRLNVEVSRGCTMGCRFCQAGMIYRPLRERSPGKALALASASIASTGYEEIAFTSLSAGDYSGLLPLLRGFNRKFEGKMVGISLPSLRVKALNEEVLREIRSVRKTGFTIAPEAATPRLRAIINKDFSEEDFERAVHTLFSEGWHNLKLYFMIGLPGERDEDIEAITEMVRGTVRTAKRHTSRYVNISVAVSPFVPKAHTPFQWAPQAGMDYIRQKKDYLRGRLRNVNVKGHDERSSMLEAAFARGDESLAKLLLAAHAEGARLDGWTEDFDYGAWLRAMDKTGIDAAGYATRSLPLDGPLPWAKVDIGVTRDFLRQEYVKALSEGKITEDCRAVCASCGLGCAEGGGAAHVSVIREAPAAAAAHLANRKPIRARVEFSKTGRMRHLSHRELFNHLARALRRAGVALDYSKGFHPSPRISFGPPLGVGVAGLREYFDMDIIPTMALSVLRDKVNGELAEGVGISRILPLGFNAPSLQGFITRYVYEVGGGDPAMVDSFMLRDSFEVMREKGPVDIRKVVESAGRGPSGRVELVLRDTPSLKVRLDEITTSVFGKQSFELDVTRLFMYGYEEGRWVMPIEEADRWQAASL